VLTAAVVLIHGTGKITNGVVRRGRRLRHRAGRFGYPGLGGGTIPRPAAGETGSERYAGFLAAAFADRFLHADLQVVEPYLPPALCQCTDSCANEPSEGA